MSERKLFSPSEEKEFRLLGLEEQQKVLLDKYAQRNETVPRGGLVLAGDSLTEFLPHHKLSLSQEVYNRGIRGIGSQFLDQHLETLVLDLAPSILVLLIGTNDLMFGMEPSLLAKKIEGLVQRVATKLPHCHIYLQSLYPRRQSEQWGPALIDEIVTSNLYLRQLSGITYLDIHSHLVDDRQELRAEFTRDGVHLTMAGYQAVLTRLSEELG